MPLWRKSAGLTVSHTLPCLSPSIDQTNLLSKRLVDWLRYASVQQGVPHTSGGFFSAPRARQVSLETQNLHVLELPSLSWPALPQGPFSSSCPSTCPGSRMIPPHLCG